MWLGIVTEGQASGELVAEVSELYQVHPTSEDAFAFDGEQLDLGPMVRELVLMELPPAPLCRPDCAGICAQCGADRNAAPCECRQDLVDPRWAGLEQLRERLESES